MRRLSISLLLLGGLMLPGMRAVSAGQVHRPEVVYVVRPGDTLWGIAGRVNERDRRETVFRLLKMNNLGSSSLSPGQHIKVPSR